MRSKILTGAAAFTLATAAGVATSAPASAQDWQGNLGDAAIRATDVVPGVVGGSATLPFWATDYYVYYDRYYPGIAYAPGYTYAPNYAYTQGYTYAPLYGYYGAYDWTPGATVEVRTRASGR